MVKNSFAKISFDISCILRGVLEKSGMRKEIRNSCRENIGSVSVTGEISRRKAEGTAGEMHTARRD